ncbi:MAG TPA: glucose 1-dehydrogenase [Gaiellaceae bacterium]|nr:glucose 1-dehydrogenase [Gaiellaceae bacterium]
MERVALVTGASTGIGWAVARRLQRDGFTLAFHTHRDDDEAASRFEEVRAAGTAAWIVGDVSETAAGERFVSQALTELGGVDVLVNNAGVTVAKPALDLGAEDFDRIFGIDVRGAFLLSVAAAREMRARGGGAIVNVTSVHEHVPRPGFALYAAAKAALGMLTRSLALELGPEGIRVNAVAPGAIATERNEEASSLNDEVPLGRPGEPEEVAGLVSYLASDEARYVTGASFLIDGGMSQQVVYRPAGG